MILGEDLRWNSCQSAWYPAPARTVATVWYERFRIIAAQRHSAASQAGWPTGQHANAG
jgi:hypothetical protein